MNEIEEVIDVFEKQIQALYTNDFETFLSFMTPRIQKELTIDIFQNAIDLYKHTPIDVDAIDMDKSRLYREGESEEIPDMHVKLILIGSGRVLCHVVYLGGLWLIDDIYWRYGDSEDSGDEIHRENTGTEEGDEIIDEESIRSEEELPEQEEDSSLKEDITPLIDQENDVEDEEDTTDEDEED